MGNNNWSADDLKKKGLVQNANGDFVPVKSLVAKKVEKLPLMGTVNSDLIMSHGLALQAKQHADAIDPIHYPGKIELPFTGLVKELREVNKYYGKQILPEKTFKLPNGEWIAPLYIFVIDPIPAPRMSQSDKWKTDPNHPDPKKRQRKPVENYFRFKNRLVSLCKVSGYKLTKISYS